MGLEEDRPKAWRTKNQEIQREDLLLVCKPQTMVPTQTIGMQASKGKHKARKQERKG
jgi:hypothetical protein